MKNLHYDKINVILGRNLKERHFVKVFLIIYLKENIVVLYFFKIFLRIE